MARDRWSSRTIFLFAAIGSAVGLGNIWRFPYLAYEYGGGAFLIPYLIALFVIGIPLLILEFAIGQKIQKGAVHAFKTVGRKFAGIGVAAIYSGFVVMIYYAAVIAWSLVYLLNSFQANLPWAGQAESYFYNNILGISESISVMGGVNITLLLALLLTWVIIFFIVKSGVKSVGKAVTVTMPLPIILLAILFIRGISLPGAMEGIALYVTPDFAALLDPAIWTAAISQIFFTLTLGFGVMVAYASFNKQLEDISTNSYITAITNTLISLFAGFVVFSVLGFMAMSQSVGINEVVASGPGLAFVVFPEALALMPLASVFAVLFFLTLFMLGIDSAFSLVEAVNTSIGDAKNVKRSHVAFVVSSVSFLLGIIFVTGAGLYYLDLVDHFAVNYGLILVGLFESVAIGWFYGADKLRMYINKVSKIKIGLWWDVSIKYVIPISLTFLLIMQFLTDITTPYGGYPPWAQAIGWVIAAIPIVLVIASKKL